VALSPASELYRLSDRHLSTNLVSTFVVRGVTRGQRGGSPAVVNLSFLGQNRYFSSSSSSFNLTRAERTPLQTHCYSENLVAPGIELRTSVLAAINMDVEY
jgi:hypothetical protein